jgi:hypothetical protein
MNARAALRAALVWLLIMAGESVFGTIRTLFVEPPLGPDLARQIAFPVALAWIFGATFLTIRWIGANGLHALLAMGLAWAALTFAFESALGRLVFDFTWAQVLADYDLTKGRLMALGLVLMALAPLIAARLRGLALIPPAP